MEPRPEGSGPDAYHEGERPAPDREVSRDREGAGQTLSRKVFGPLPPGRGSKEGQSLQHDGDHFRGAHFPSVIRTRLSAATARHGFASPTSCALSQPAAGAPAAPYPPSN